MIADQVDLDKILSLASAKKSVDMPVSVIASSNLTISVAKDPAFGFYYQDKILSKSTWSAIIRAALLINC
jgi:cobyrinic acid a,c-diamide synthase